MTRNQFNALMDYIEAMRMDAIYSARHGNRHNDEVLQPQTKAAREILETSGIIEDGVGG